MSHSSSFSLAQFPLEDAHSGVLIRRRGIDGVGDPHPFYHYPPLPFSTTFEVLDGNGRTHHSNNTGQQRWRLDKFDGLEAEEQPSSSSQLWEGVVGWDLVNARLEKSGLVHQRLPFPNSYVPSHIQDTILIQKTILKLLVRVDKTNKENQVLKAALNGVSEAKRRQNGEDEVVEMKEEYEGVDDSGRRMRSFRPETTMVLQQSLRVCENTIHQLQAENQALQSELKRLILDFDRVKSEMLLTQQETVEESVGEDRLIVKRISKQLNVTTTEELFNSVSKLVKVCFLFLSQQQAATTTIITKNKRCLMV